MDPTLSRRFPTASSWRKPKNPVSSSSESKEETKINPFKKRKTETSKIIYRYSNGWDCPHCMWINNYYPRTPSGRKAPRMKPAFYVNDYITVFNSSSEFTHSFNCVLNWHIGGDRRVKKRVNEQVGQVENIDSGVDESKKPVTHYDTDVSYLLTGATQFIEYLYSEYNIHDTRLLFNSSFVSKYNEKEHLHAWVSINSSSDVKKGVKEGIIVETGRRMISFAPYEGDIEYKLSSEDCYELIRKREPVKWLEERIGERIGEEDSFYLFLKYECYPKGAKCGIEGVISFPGGG